MADKIVTDDILQKAIQDTIQIIADNIFEFESYDDESIANLFNLTPEEAQHISDLIADTVISQYKLWSSKKVSDELLSAKNECNDYTDTRLANISSISLKYCTALPTTGESNCIYILKSTDSNPDTLNLYDGTWITIGSFTIKLDDFYKKSEIDTKLDLKADKTEILAQDDVITDTSLATTTNVLSATTTIEELDKKVDKTSIVTSISSTSTDDTVPSAKAVYNAINTLDNNVCHVKQTLLFESGANGESDGSIIIGKEYTAKESILPHRMATVLTYWRECAFTKANWYNENWFYIDGHANDYNEEQNILFTYEIRILVKQSDTKIFKVLYSKRLAFNLNDNTFTSTDIKSGIALSKFV